MLFLGIVLGLFAISKTAAAPGQTTFYSGDALVIQENTLMATQYRKVVKLRQRALLEDIDRMMRPTTESYPELVKRAINAYTSQYGIDYDKALQVVMCESGMNNTVIGDNGKAAGIFQFHYPTFERFCNGNYYDMQDQAQCYAKMVSIGLHRHWSCW